MKKKRFWVAHESVFALPFWCFVGMCLGLIIAAVTGKFK